MSSYPSHEAIFKLEQEITAMKISNWMHHDINSFQFWLLLFFLIVPWFLWWKLVDKKRLFEILLYGSFILIFASYLDAIGSELTLWEYRFYIIPYGPV